MTSQVLVAAAVSGLRAEVVGERLRLLAGVHGQLEELGLDAGRLQRRRSRRWRGQLAGGVARLLVADDDAALDAHRDQPLRGQLAGGALVGAGAEQEDVVRVARPAAPAGGAAALPKAMPASLARAATSV